MSNIVGTMEEALDSGLDIIATLELVERELGWRLVPVEGTDHQLDVLAEVYEDRGDSFAYREAVQAAPRPWADQDEVKG